MKLYLITLVIALAGCYQQINQGEILWAENACRDHGGINNISAAAFGLEAFECGDGTKGQVFGKLVREVK